MRRNGGQLLGREPEQREERERRERDRELLREVDLAALDEPVDEGVDRARRTRPRASPSRVARTAGRGSCGTSCAAGGSIWSGMSGRTLQRSTAAMFDEKTSGFRNASSITSRRLSSTPMPSMASDGRALAQRLEHGLGMPEHLRVHQRERVVDRVGVPREWGRAVRPWSDVRSNAADVGVSGGDEPDAAGLVAPSTGPISNSTVWPSRSRWPETSSAEWWTKTSSLPGTGDEPEAAAGCRRT